MSCMHAGESIFLQILKLIPFSRKNRRDHFYLLDYVTRRFEKWDLKKKKDFCLTLPQNCSFLASSEITEKLII